MAIASQIPARPGGQLGHVVDERGVLLQGDGLVALGDQAVAHVAHEQRRPPTARPEAPGGAHHGVVDRGRVEVEQARRPHRDLPAGQVAQPPRQPVVLHVHGLEHVALAGDFGPVDAIEPLYVRAPDAEASLR